MLRSLLLVVLPISLIHLSLVAAQTPVAPQRTPITFEFAANVSTDDQDLIREAVRFAQDYYIKTLGTDVRQPVTVNVINDASQQVNYSRDDEIHFNTATFKYVPVLIRYQMLTREYFHLWQEDASHHSFASPTEVHPFGPQWLIEGSAQYVAAQALTTTGIVSEAEVQERIVRIANGAQTPNPPVLPPLATLQTNEDMTATHAEGAAYSLSALAVQLLAGSSCPQAVGKYFQAFAHTDASWQIVFAQVFHTSVDDFYASFEAQRPTLLTPTGIDVTQLLRTPQYNDAPADIRPGGAPPALVKGTQVVIYAWSGNGSTCTLTATDANGQQLASDPTHADVYGLVVWLWSVPERIATPTVSLELSCGASPLTLALPVT